MFGKEICPGRQQPTLHDAFRMFMADEMCDEQITGHVVLAALDFYEPTLLQHAVDAGLYFDMRGPKRGNTQEPAHRLDASTGGPHVATLQDGAQT